jgi:two-component system, response regulator PdtaR
MASEERLAFGLAQGAPAASGRLHEAADTKGGATSGAPGTAANGNLCLEGLQILVVEDEFLLAMEVEATLISFGCSVIGPFAKLAKALDAARRTPLDGAVLDINLNGDMVYPLVDLLYARGIPFAFLTGYVASDIPERFRSFQRMQKPLHPFTLRGVLTDLLRGPERPQTT